MKVLKIRLRSSGNRIIYPPNYDSVKVEDHLYCDDKVAGICYLFILVEDGDVGKVDASPDVVEITVSEAETFINNCGIDQKVMNMTDEGKIRRLEILTKVDKDYVLTEEDQKALDPEDPTPGVRWSDTFIDKVRMRMGK